MDYDEFWSVSEVYIGRTMPERIVVLWYSDDGRGVLLESFNACRTKPSTVLVGPAAINAPFPRVTAQTFG
jgi:hypothetical protein